MAHLTLNSITNNGNGVDIPIGSVVSLDCNRILDNTVGLTSDTDATTANSNSILGNTIGVDGSSSAGR